MRLVMMGTGPFAVPTFNALLDGHHDLLALFTRPIPPARGRQKTKANPMRDVAEARGLEIFAPQSINDPPSQEQLRSLQADLMVVCDYGQILSRETLATSRLGGINLHGSLLPKYRGAAPVNWALYHGDATTGVTVIHMTPKLDGGPCLTRRELQIGADENAVELEQRLSELGVEAVHEAIGLLDGWDGTSAIGQIQESSLATKAPRLNKNDGAVDWSRSAQQIRNQVRAFKPWPNCFTYWYRNSGQSMRLILDQVSVAPDAELTAAPGEVVLSNDKQVLVATGDGLLCLDRVQPAGKRAMSIAEFLRGNKVATGDQFGRKS